MARNRQRNRSPRPAPDPGLDPLFPAAGRRRPARRSRDDPPVAFADGGDEDLDAAQPGVRQARATLAATQPLPSGNRVIDFLRASWAELQRVQWPDRQQVAQATGVVLGFVVVTGIFLGIADYLAGKLINFII